jgi:hypothetical protein
LKSPRGDAPAENGASETGPSTRGGRASTVLLVSCRPQAAPQSRTQRADNGCYNTSIDSVIVAALANRAVDLELLNAPPPSTPSDP